MNQEISRESRMKGKELNNDIQPSKSGMEKQERIKHKNITKYRSKNKR